MPTADSTAHPEDKERDRDRDRGDRDTERGERGQRQKPIPTSGSKTKDLSHVPCKFFKVGGCTAGSSCPFSHAIPEPGGQKEPCAWFVKGNCKFGHKCALAHILPGQSMSMDRKNKKAAQLAAAAAAGNNIGDKGERGKEGKGGRKREHGGSGAVLGSGVSANRNPLLTGGSTAPTRVLHNPSAGRMPLKASISPSAPAPPLASFGVLEELEGAGVQLPTAPAHGKQTTSEANNATPASDGPSQEKDLQSKQPSGTSPGPLPRSVPRPTAISNKSHPDFGPIGSPPTTNHTSPRNKSNGPAGLDTSAQHVNGITVVPSSPTNKDLNDNAGGFISTSPFSAPGTQSMFAGSFTATAGVAASLGSGLAMMGGKKDWGSLAEPGSVGARGSAAALGQHQQHANGRMELEMNFEYDEFSGAAGGRRSVVPANGKAADVAVEDEDLEDFIPSSLTDLLTPEERSRRMSRSNSGQPPATALPVSGAAGLGVGSVGGNGTGLGHRYSRSVPAPSLLGDIKSIWADTSTPHALPASPSGHRVTSSSTRFDGGPGSGVGTPAAGASASDELGLSVSYGSAGGLANLSPSNASAAFLPGLHSHYLAAKAKQAQAQAQLGLGGLARGLRGTSGPLYGGTGTGATGITSGLTANYLSGAALSPPTGSSGLHTHKATSTTYRLTPSPFDLTQQPHLYHLQPQHPHTARPIPSNGAGGHHHHNSTSSTHLQALGGLADDPHLGLTHLLSPNTRALQSHAPGQSLPQGLAAGYSRIHALPPPPSLASPGSASLYGSVGAAGEALSAPSANHAAGGVPSSGPYGEWKTSMTVPASPPPPSHTPSAQQAAAAAAGRSNATTPVNVSAAGTTTVNSHAAAPSTSALENMFSRLSYSAATARMSGTPVTAATTASAVGSAGPAAAAALSVNASTNGMGPPGLQRNVSAGRYPNVQQSPLSPLGGPVVTADDDDDLFRMDG